MVDMSGLVFKQGDIIKFRQEETNNGWLLSNGISTSTLYTVKECKLDQRCRTGVMVRVHGMEEREWDVSWFELDKNSIVISILNDL